MLAYFNKNLIYIPFDCVVVLTPRSKVSVACNPTHIESTMQPTPVFESFPGSDSEIKIT